MASTPRASPAIWRARPWTSMHRRHVADRRLRPAARTAQPDHPVRDRGQRSAGAVALTDDALQRREVALIDAQGEDEQQALLSPLHYLRQALAPTADLMEGGAVRHAAGQSRRVDPRRCRDALARRGSGADRLGRGGGLLVRFAGPRLAASDVARDAAGPLMPVRLRAGGRTVGGAMSWGEPKALSPFPEARRSSGSPSPRT
jgi:hypothetical protein